MIIVIQISTLCRQPQSLILVLRVYTLTWEDVPDGHLMIVMTAYKISRALQAWKNGMEWDCQHNVRQLGCIIKLKLISSLEAWNTKSHNRICRSWRVTLFPILKGLSCSGDADISRHIIIHILIFLEGVSQCSQCRAVDMPKGLSQLDLCCNHWLGLSIIMICLSLCQA